MQITYDIFSLYTYVLTFYPFFLAFYLASILTFYLASIQAFILAFYLASILTFFLTFCLDLSGILSDICSDILFGDMEFRSRRRHKLGEEQQGGSECELREPGTSLGENLEAFTWQAGKHSKTIQR
jgi:hypothetical protein